jgi:hypothetical protein
MKATSRISEALTKPWPTREEWAKKRRTEDRLGDLSVSCELKNYATPEEVESLVAALKALYQVEGRKLKEAKQLAGPLLQQPGENRLSYFHRCRVLPEAEGNLLQEVWRHQRTRSEINQQLRTIAKGELPDHLWRQPQIEVLLTTILARRDAAREAAWEVRRRQIEATPIDDAAWEEELRRRADIEEWRKTKVR